MTVAVIPMPPVVEKTSGKNDSVQFLFLVLLHLVPAIALNQSGIVATWQERVKHPYIKNASCRLLRPKKLSAATSSCAPSCLFAVRWTQCLWVTGWSWAQQWYHKAPCGRWKGSHHENSLKPVQQWTNQLGKLYITRIFTRCATLPLVGNFLDFP